MRRDKNKYYVGARKLNAIGVATHIIIGSNKDQVFDYMLDKYEFMPVDFDCMATMYLNDFIVIDIAKGE